MTDLSVLSEREHEICKLLLEGKSSKEITFILDISLGTVNFHRNNLYKKLGIKSINELYKKYLPVIPNIPRSKKALPFNIIIPAAVVIIAVLICVIVVFGGKKEKEQETVFDFWFAVGDNISQTNVTRRREVISGKEELVVTITGNLTAANGLVSGVYGRPNANTLEALRYSAKTISFYYLGDGNTYAVELPTFETMDNQFLQDVTLEKDTIHGDHFLVILPTEKDVISNITINIPEDLIRLGIDSEDIEFIQKNIIFFQIQPMDFGDYRLKFWDIKLN